MNTPLYHRSSIASILATGALVVIAILPLQTGLDRAAQVLNAPASTLLLIRLWKDVAIGAIVLGFLFLVVRGSLRVRYLYCIGLIMWAWFFIYLALRMVLDGPSAGGLYALRVYVEPVLGGLTIGAVVGLSQKQQSMVRIVIAVSVIVFLSALLQVLFPFSGIATAFRNVAADQFGTLPNAFTVSFINQFRPFGTFSDPNDFGFFAVIVLILTFAIPSQQVKHARRSLLVFRAMCLGALTLSFSRSALLAAVMSTSTLIGLWIVLEPTRVMSIRLRTLGIALGTATVLVGTAIAVGQQSPQLRHIANTLNQADPSAKGHMESLAAGLRDLTKRPEGFGLGHVGPRAGLYGGGKVYHVESSYLQIALEAGVAGLALYALAALWMVGAALWDATRHPELRHWSVAVVALLVAQAAAYTFLPTIVSLQTGCLIWAVVGVLMVQRGSAERVAASLRSALLTDR